MEVNSLSGMKYVKTGYGVLPIADIPIVTDEQDVSKLAKAAIFYGIIIIVLIFFIYLSFYADQQNNKGTVTDMLNTSNLRKVFNTEKIDAIDVYCPFEHIFVENIVLQTADDNIINIDTANNSYVDIYEKKNGLMYSIQFNYEIEIKSITIISDEQRFINHISIDLFNRGKKVWEFNGKLADRRENVVYITQAAVPIRAKEPLEEYNIELMSEKAKTVINEDALMVQLTEDDEKYMSHF